MKVLSSLFAFWIAVGFPVKLYAVWHDGESLEPAETTTRQIARPLFDADATAASFETLDDSGKSPSVTLLGFSEALQSVEFRQDPENKELVRVALKGTSVSREFPKAIPLRKLEQGERISISVSGVKDKIRGVDVIGSAELDFRYIPETGQIRIYRTDATLKASWMFYPAKIRFEKLSGRRKE